MGAKQGKRGRGEGVVVLVEAKSTTLYTQQYRLHSCHCQPSSINITSDTQIQLRLLQFPYLEDAQGRLGVSPGPLVWTKHVLRHVYC